MHGFGPGGGEPTAASPRRGGREGRESGAGWSPGGPAAGKGSPFPLPILAARGSGDVAVSSSLQRASAPAASALLPFRPHPPARAAAPSSAARAAAAHLWRGAHPHPWRGWRAEGSAPRAPGARAPQRKGAGKGFRAWAQAGGDAREDETAAGAVSGGAPEWWAAARAADVALDPAPRVASGPRAAQLLPESQAGRWPGAGGRQADSHVPRRAPSAATCAPEPSSAGGARGVKLEP